MSNFELKAASWCDVAHDHVIAWRRGCEVFDLSGPAPNPRGLLVGEAPGPNTDARLPLFPEPRNSAGGRLLKYADIDPVDWLGKLVRVNLCDEQWSARRAMRGRARIMMYLFDPRNWVDGEPLRVLLLGQRVAREWSCFGSFGHVEMRFYDGPTLHVAWIPHPSGKNLLYNSRRNQLRARRAVLWAIGDRDVP